MLTVKDCNLKFQLFLYAQYIFLEKKNFYGRIASLIDRCAEIDLSVFEEINFVENITPGASTKQNNEYIVIKKYE